MEKKWKRFEDLAAHIQKSLAPAAVVQQNIRVRGKASGVDRQIDIAVRTRVGQFDLFVVIDCKDYKATVDVKDVESFAAMLKDVGANKGALIASKGFSEAARNVAKDAGISLYTLVDAESEDWPAFVAIPVLIEDFDLEAVQYRISSVEVRSFKLGDVQSTLLFRKDGTRIGPVRDLVAAKWNDAEQPYSEGIHANIPLSTEPTYMRDDDRLALVEFAADFKVKKTFYFGHLPLAKVQGFRDAHTGDLHTNALTTDWLDFKTVRKNWEVLSSDDALAVTPVMKLVQSTHIPLEGEVEPGR